MSGAPTVAVIVPSYGRSVLLETCLRALDRQTRRAHEVIVVARSDDAASQRVVASLPGPARVVLVEEPGLGPAMFAGARAATSDVVAFTDDDAEPRPDWIARISASFRDPGLAGLGGRDVIPGHEHDGPTDRAGTISRLGKLVGDHHCRGTTAHDAAILKGVNMAYRRAGFRLPVGFRGAGAQVHTEVAIGMDLLARGGHVIFDPELVVDHRPGPRPAFEPRSGRNREATSDAAYNLISALSFGPRGMRMRTMPYALLVGDSGAPGVARALLAFAHRDAVVQARARPALAGKLRALTDRIRRRGPALVPATGSRPPAVTLVAHDVGGIGGMERQLDHHVRGLLALGHAVTVVSRTCHLPPDPNLDWVRVRTPARPFVLAYPAFALTAGLVLLRRRSALVHTTGAIVFNGADLCTVHYCHAALPASALQNAAAAGRPRSLHAAVAHRLSLLGERLAYRPTRTRELVAVSPGVAREIEAQFPAMTGRMTVIPEGVDPERFRPHKQARARIRRSLSVGAEDLLAVFVGGDWGRKRLNTAVEAIAGAGRWQLAVCGQGDAAAYVSLARQLGAESRVHFLGPRPDIEDVLAAGDAFLLPTSYETFSLATYEAASTGLPLLVSRVNGVEDILQEGTNGWAVADDPADIARKLTVLATDHALRASMATAARQAVSGHGWDAAVSAYSDLLIRLASGCATTKNRRSGHTV